MFNVFAGTMIALLMSVLLGMLGCGVYFFYETNLTGPCAHKGGVSATEQDYVFCFNGTRVDLPPSNGNSYTVRWYD